MEHLDADRERPVIEARDVLRMVRSHWLAIAIITLVCTLLVLGWTLLQPKIYSSTATGLVVATGEQDLVSALAGDNLAQSKAVSYESLVSSRPVAERVIERLDLDLSPEVLLSTVSTDVPPDTVEIRITVEAEDPSAAADLANTWVIALAEQVQVLENGGDESAVNRVAVQPLSNASLPLEPSSPNFDLNIVLGLLCGLGLGLLYAFVRYMTDRRIRSLDEIQSDFGVDVLGVIPIDERLADRREVIGNGSSGDRSHQETVEALRELRTNLSFVSVDRPPRKIVVTSPLPDEGKSTITANLAVAFASTGRNVVVVDGDLRSPAMTHMFGFEPSVGMTDVLANNADLHDVLQPFEAIPTLQVLGAGTVVAESTELLSSPRVEQMLDVLAEDSIVLIDAPPLLNVTDAALLTASADGAVVVITAQRTTQDELAKSLDNLRQVHGNVLGVVLNRVPTTRPDAEYYGYYGKNYRTSSDEQSERGTRGKPPRTQPAGRRKRQAPVAPVSRDSTPVAKPSAPAQSTTDKQSTASRTFGGEMWEKSGWRGGSSTSASS